MEKKIKKFNENDNNRIKEILSDEKQITEILQHAIHEAILVHKRAGNPIAVWKNEEVVWIENY